MEIEKLRHSLSHILASSIRELYPDVKFGMGPAIDNGFYYDFEFENPLSPETLPQLEKKMRELIKRGFLFKKNKVEWVSIGK